MPLVTLRFVTSNNLISNSIRAQAGVCMPFVPSHTEALARDEKHWIGAHAAGGVMARPVGYDAAEPGLKEAFVNLPVPDAQYDSFHAFLEGKIGEPYDFEAILGFVDPIRHHHDPGHVICSALMVLCLRAGNFFRWPLTVPAHHISPRDLFLILSTHVEIAH